MLSVLFPTRHRRARREMLRLGAMGSWPIGVLPRVGNAQEPSQKGREASPRSVVMVFLFGGPSQVDLWDMKPQAPAEIRGEFRPISTSAPGVEICEHLPLLAGQMHHLGLVRSMTHQMPVHGPACSEIYTGRPYPLPPTTDQARREDWPSLASLVTRYGDETRGLPPAVVLPWYSQFMGQSARIAGQTGGRMGDEYDPFLLPADLQQGRFDTQELRLASLSEVQRLERRRQLLARLQDQQANAREIRGRGSAAERSWLQHHSTAARLLSEGHLGTALDFDQERPETVVRYGPSVFARSLLAARRLIEAGVPLITVNWYDDSFHDKVSPHWDQHNHLATSLKDRLLPVFDRAFSGFIEDLAARDLLQNTMVAVAGEFGRTPRIGQFTQNAMTEMSGRDHWPHAFTVLLAGGGIRGGQVYGATDHQGGQVRDNPVSPADLAATLLNHLQVDSSHGYWDPIQAERQQLSIGSVIPLERA